MGSYKPLRFVAIYYATIENRDASFVKCLFKLLIGLFILLLRKSLIMNRHWNLSSVFYASIVLIICFFPFILLICPNELFSFWALNQSCIPVINSSCLWYHLLFIYSWIQFTSILFRNFASVLMMDVSL